MRETGFSERNDEMKGLLIFVIAGISFARAVNLPQRLMPPALDSLILAGIDQTLRQRYEDASATFRMASSEYPQHPAGYLYQAAVLQTIAMDYELRVPENEFDSLLAVVKDLASQMVKRNPDSPWPYFFLGSMLGYESYEHSQRGDWFGAATKGLSSASNFEKAIDLDSTFYDGYAGIGTYYYWKTRKIEFLSWLPFVGDRRAEGIRYLHVCAAEGRYNRFAALSSLAAIYIDAGEYPKAEDIAGQALRNYPANRIFLWQLATAREKSGRLRMAQATYEALLKEIVIDPKPNPYNELVCRLNLAKIKLHFGGGLAVKVDLDAIISMKDARFPGHLQDRAEEKLEEARSLRQEISGRGK